MSVVLHGLAATLWLVALMLAVGAGSAIQGKDLRSARFLLALNVLLSGVAFTLQVLA